MSAKDIIDKKLVKTDKTYEAHLLENDNEEYIAIECSNGHLYRIALTDSKFNYHIEHCPFCLKHNKRIFKNSKYLPHNVNCMQSLADLFDKYMRLGSSYSTWLKYSSLFEYINSTFIFQIDKNTSDMTDEGFNISNVVDKNIKDLDIRHLDNFYTYECDDFSQVIIPAIIKSFNLESNDSTIYDFLQTIEKSELIALFNQHSLLRKNIEYCIFRAVRDYIEENLEFESINIDNIDNIDKLESNTYYYDGRTITTKEKIQENYGIVTPKLVCRTIEIYKKNENKIVKDIKDDSIAKNKKKIKELKSQITLLENDIQEKLKQVDNIKQQINSLCGKQIYNSTTIIDNNLYMWLLNCKDRELAEIILNNYSTKNSMRLTEIPIDSKETIWIRGKSGTNFKTSAFVITSQKKVLSKLPKGASYPELFIYYYFKSIFPKTIHRGKAPDTRYEYDISIPEKGLVIEYNGSVYHKGKGQFDKTEIDTIKMNYAIDNGVDYIRIEDDGNNDIYFSDRLITFNGNVKNLDEKLYEICTIIKNKKLHSTKLKAITIEQIKRQIRLYY